MDPTRLQQALQGVAITTATPFSEDLRSVDLDALKGNMEYLLRAGGKFLVATPGSSIHLRLMSGSEY